MFFNAVGGVITDDFVKPILRKRKNLVKSIVFETNV